MDHQKLYKAYLLKQKKRLHEQVALASQLYKNLTADLALVEEELKLTEPQTIKTANTDQKVTVITKSKTTSKQQAAKSFKESYSSNAVPSQNIYTEQYSKIRIHKMLVPPEFISQELKGKIFVPIDQLIDHYIDYNQANNDWFTFGVLYHKLLAKNEAGKALMVFCLTDLKGSHFRLLLDAKAFTLLQDEEIGCVLGVLNSKIFKPSQKNACAALYINNPDKYVKLGASVDLAWCKEMGCQEILNKHMNAVHCDHHRERKYKDARFHRQEFAVGTDHFQIGAPTGTANQKPIASIKNRANYFLGKDGRLTAQGLRAEFNLALEVTAQAASSDQLDAIVNSHSVGGAMVRKSIGLEKDESEAQFAFGPTALAKMGGNPNRPKSTDSSPKASPSKRKVDEVAAIVNACKGGHLLMGINPLMVGKHSSPKGSPLKTKNSVIKKQRVASSDDDFEIVIAN